MKLVKCNKCKDEYYICEEFDKIGFPVSTEKCGMCGATDYTVLDDNIKLKVIKSDIEDECDLEIQNADIKHSLALFKEELEELIKTYIEPFLR